MHNMQYLCKHLLKNQVQSVQVQWFMIFQMSYSMARGVGAHAGSQYNCCDVAEWGWSITYSRSYSRSGWSRCLSQSSGTLAFIYSTRCVD